MNLDLELRFREYASGALRGLQSVSRGVFSDIDNSIMGTKRYMDKLGESVKINVDTSGLDRVQGKVRDLTSAWDVMRGTVMGQIAFRGIERGAGFVRDQVGSVLTSGMEAGVMRKQFEVIAGKDAGGKLFGDLRQYIADSIFGTELYGNVRSMLSYGVDAKNIMADTKMLGDIAMGDKTRMGNLSYVYSQSKSAGLLKGDDLRQYIAVGFNPLQELSMMTGRSLSKLTEEMSENKISFNMIHAAMEHATGSMGKFNGMLDQIAQTSYGKWQAMLGNIDMAKQDFGVKLEPVLNRLLDRMKPIVDNLPNTLEKLVPVMERLGNGALNWVDWLSKNTDSLLRLASVIEDSVKVWVAVQGLSLIKNTAGAFMEGLAGNAAGGVMGGMLGGGAGLTTGRLLGMGAGHLELMMGSTAMGVLGTVGGIAGLVGIVAYAAWDTWKRYEEVKDRNMLLAKQYEHTAQMGGVSANPNNPHTGYLTREQMSGTANKGIFGLLREKSSLIIDFRDDKYKGVSGDGGGSSTVSDAILGGGQRSFTINNNAPLYQVQHQVFQKLNDAIEDFEPKVQEALRRIMHTLPVARA